MRKSGAWSVLIVGVLFAVVSGAAKADFTSRFPRLPSSIEEPLLGADTAQQVTARIQKTIESCVPELERQFGRPWTRAKKGFAGYGGLRLNVFKGENKDCKSQACTSGEGDDVLIEFALEPMISGFRNVDRVVCHEMVHAYFRRFLSHEQYSALPRWAREGSAVYMAGQLSERLHIALVRDFETPLRLINGLEGKHTEDDYLEDALAFEFMGSVNALKVMTDVLNGAEIYRAIEKNTGFNKTDFLSAALASARAHVMTAWLKYPVELSDALKASRGKTSDELARVPKLLWKVLDERGVKISEDGAVSGAIDASAAYALFEVSQRDSALIVNTKRGLGLLRFLLAAIPNEYYGAWTANLRYSMAYLQLRQGNTREAINEYARVYLLHLESPNLRGGAAMGLARAYFEAGDYATALKWLEAHFDDPTAVGDEVKYRLAVCYFKLCQPGKAVNLLEELAKGPDSHVMVQNARELLKRIKSGEEVMPICARRAGH